MPRCCWPPAVHLRKRTARSIRCVSKPSWPRPRPTSGRPLCRCDRRGVFRRLELPRRRDRRPHFCGRGPARRQRSPARRARSHLGAPDFRGRRSRAESGEGRLCASETALRRREPARDQVGRGADRLRQAEAAFGIAKKNLEDCSLYAPFSGVVGQRRISAGETALPAFPC